VAIAAVAVAPISAILGRALLAQANQPLAPAPVKASDLKVRIEPVGKLPSKGNLAAPVAAGAVLLLVDQSGVIYRWDGTAAAILLGPRDVPSGLKLAAPEAVQNVAATQAGDRVFVTFTSTSVPKDVPKRVSPRAGADAWQVIYRYEFDGKTLSQPKPITALQVRTDGHTGGGLAVIADGSLLLATGDNGDAGEDGQTYAQDPANHLSKILRISPADGSVEIIARGVRNVQRLDVEKREDVEWLDFVDMGGSVAEELNSVRVADLLDRSQPHNFGWGKFPADRQSREGTFYINSGGGAMAMAPIPEPGFIQPIAQFGREGAKDFVSTGPVSSPKSFVNITWLMSDLVGGALYATTGARSKTLQDVSRVTLVDANSQPVTLKALAGGERPDPRFFTYPDGTAGVLLERTGAFYRLTEIGATGGGGVAPAALQEGFFDSNGVRIHYLEQGTGEPVVLVHPLDSNARAWIANGVMPDLARDHRVIALDCRGHGQSDKPHDPKQYGPEMALDLARLLDHLSLKQAHVVGYSMGAELAAILLVRQPERFLTVTLGAGAGRFEWVSTDAQHAEEEALEYENLGVSPKLFLEESPPTTPDPEVEDLRKQQAATLADKTRDRAALAAFSRARKDRLITSGQTAAVTVPTLGIAGSLDPALEWLQKLQKMRAAVKLVVIDGATHSGAKAAIGQPQFLAAVREFITSARR